MIFDFVISSLAFWLKGNACCHQPDITDSALKLVDRSPSDQEKDIRMQKGAIDLFFISIVQELDSRLLFHVSSDKVE